MEITLNIMWGLVAAWAFWFWRSERYRSAPAGRSPLPSGLLALTCALILLFPVISLTDDLHAELAVMEDGSGSVLKAQTVTQGGSRAGKLHFLSCVASPNRGRTVLVVLSLVVPIEFPANRTHSVQRPQDRAPPV